MLWNISKSRKYSSELTLDDRGKALNLDTSAGGDPFASSELSTQPKRSSASFLGRKKGSTMSHISNPDDPVSAPLPSSMASKPDSVEGLDNRGGRMVSIDPTGTRIASVDTGDDSASSMSFFSTKSGSNRSVPYQSGMMSTDNPPKLNNKIDIFMTNTKNGVTRRMPMDMGRFK